MSGRDLFIYDASNIQDDEEAGDVEFEKEEVDVSIFETKCIKDKLEKIF